jgi:hypothetical protein
MNEIDVQLSALAAKFLTAKDVEQALTYAISQAETSGWQVGQCYDVTFNKSGRRFMVCVNNEANGINAIVATPGGVEFEDDSPMAEGLN